MLREHGLRKPYDDTTIFESNRFSRESIMFGKTVREICYTEVEADWINEINSVLGKAYFSQGTEDSFDVNEQIAVYNWNGTPFSETSLTIRRSLTVGDMWFKVDLNRRLHGQQVQLCCHRVSKIMVDPITQYIGFFDQSLTLEEPAIKVSSQGKISVSL